MCGIAGIFAYGDTADLVDHEELLKLREMMRKRGPDGAGLWIANDGSVGLAHRRLSIIELSEAAAQPMVSTNKQYRIVFNGEIYNYRVLRQQLINDGYSFRTQSDTEVLLHLYAQKGELMVHELRGMYAFAIWDENRRGLFAARDPFGIKPFYYSDNGKTFIFASQVKSLVSNSKIDKSPCPAGHIGFFLWGSVPDPFTLYKGIQALPAGYSLWVDKDGNRKEKRYFCISDVLRNAEVNSHTIDSSEPVLPLANAFDDTVRHHLIADVPVGVFLSSGLDSSLLAAKSSEYVQELHTITLGFKEYSGTDDDETPLAEMVARHYRTNHKTSWIARADFNEEFEALLEDMDQPTIDGVNTYFVSRAAAGKGLKAMLSGLGGDELFGTYPSFTDVPRIVKHFSVYSKMSLLGKGFRWISAPLLKQFTSPKYAGLFEYGGTWGGAYFLRRGLFMPWELPTFLDGDMVRLGWEKLQTLESLQHTEEVVSSDRAKIMALEMEWYMRNQLLRDADWAGMAHSLEIRVPLVDPILLASSASFFLAHSDMKKRIFNHALKRPLPQALLDRTKTGFSVPTAQWARERLGQTGTGRGLRDWARWVYDSAMSCS